jgi:hypothetical protein
MCVIWIIVYHSGRSVWGVDLAVPWLRRLVAGLVTRRIYGGESGTGIGSPKVPKNKAQKTQEEERHRLYKNRTSTKKGLLLKCGSFKAY